MSEERETPAPEAPSAEKALGKPIQTPKKRVRSAVELHEYDNEYGTPQKAMVRGTISYLHAKKIPFFKEDVFRHFGVSHASGYRMINPESSVRRYDTLVHHNPRHRPRKVTPEKLREMEAILENEGIEARCFTWEQLGTEVGLDVCGRTIKRALETLQYRKCIACKKGWVNRRTAEKRVEHARRMLENYSTPENWHSVRFSDEVHFGWGPQGKLRIIRKPGMRYCPDCIQEEAIPLEKDQKRFHCWAAVGHNFKSDIIFYDVPGNKNGKMTHEVYINSILEPVVKPWLEAGHDFVLEEDNDSGHGPGAKNIVRDWKAKHSLRSYFNCPCSPDLSPIENCWLPPKETLRKVPHWDDATTRELIIEGWGRVSQEFINEKVSSMPARYRAVLEGDGKMTGY
jgi:transposase